MPEKQSANVPVEGPQGPLPPVFEKLLADLSGDRRKLLRDENFGKSAEQLRAYIGQYVYPRIDETVRALAQAVMETYGLAFSNANELRRLHRFTVDELNELGADLPEDDAPLPGVSAEVLDEFQAAFYALGTHLQEKYPDDKDTEAAYNRVAEKVGEMVEELMSGYEYDDGDAPSEEGEPDDGGDDQGEADEGDAEEPGSDG